MDGHGDVRCGRRRPACHICPGQKWMESWLFLPFCHRCHCFNLLPLVSIPFQQCPLSANLFPACVWTVFLDLLSSRKELVHNCNECPSVFRYRAKLKLQEEYLPLSYSKQSIVPKAEDVPDECLPTDVDPETVFLCRHVYDFRQKRILKNPSWSCAK
jgi:hypothetical protein